MDSDDGDDGYFRPSVLPVADFNDYNPSKPPTSGEEYLRRVQLEAEKCPDVVVSKLDLNSFHSNQTETISLMNGFIPASREQKMPMDRQQDIITHFTGVRMRVSGMRKRMPEGVLEHQKIPGINDHQGWKAFIFGEDEDSSFEQDRLPHLSLLLNLDQVSHHKLLKYLARWMVEDDFDKKFGIWIFSLIACIEKPLQSEVYATLRDISRTCSSIRNRNNVDCEDLRSINIIVCIIGRYFDQTDMVDE